MPKDTDSYALIWEIHGEKIWAYGAKNDFAFCKMCSTKCIPKRYCTVVQYVASMNHEAKTELGEAGGPHRDRRQHLKLSLQPSTTS